MKVYNFQDYDLYLSYDPADLFKQFNVTEMHGLSLKDCLEDVNTPEDSYIAGWCNLTPGTDRPFVFINLTRCTTDVYTTALIMHEMNHLYWILYKDCIIEYEETIITKAEEETYKVFQLIRDSQIAN